MLTVLSKVAALTTLRVLVTSASFTTNCSPLKYLADTLVPCAKLPAVPIMETTPAVPLDPTAPSAPTGPAGPGGPAGAAGPSGPGIGWEATTFFTTSVI